jgi:hypothetical protein
VKDPNVVEPPAPEPSLEPRPPGSDSAHAAILHPGQGVVKRAVEFYEAKALDALGS